MNLAILILGTCIALGSIDVMRIMHKGDKPCRVAKYVLAALTGFMLAWYAAHGVGGAMHLFGAITLMLFIWPEIYYRVIDYIQMRFPKIYILYLTHFDIKDRRSR